MDAPLDRLIAALIAQAEAINRLAESNEALVMAMSEERDEPQEQYLNGTTL